MTDDERERFDFMKVTGAGFRRRKPKPDKKYATLNRRMLAATVDSIIIMITIAPIADWLFNMYYGPVPVDLRLLREQVSQQHDQHQALVMFWNKLVETGFVSRWVANTTVQTLVLFGFTGICWHFWSATPGKMLLRIKVVDAKTEGHISDLQIILRLMGYGVSAVFFCLGFFWIGWDKKKQGWHDKLAETVVITQPWKFWAQPKSGPGAAGPSDSPGPSSEV